MSRDVLKRNSNIELLRIVAMFLVLIVHADFFSLGPPSPVDIRADFEDSLLRIFFQSLSIACVDIFVFISGWFGIKPKIKGLTNFVFQCLFFLVGIYLFSLLVGTSTLSVVGIRDCFAATSLNWFIKAYLLLYILSPVLNAFVENTDRKSFKYVLIGFYAFQFVYGWVFSSSTAFINDGYSVISFIGLYLLARYIKLFQPSFAKFKKSTDLLIVGVIVIAVTILYVLSPESGNRLLNYISPTTLLISLFTVLAFSKFTINSKCINWCAASSFAVFLLHTNPNVIWHYKDMCIILHNSLSPLCYWGVLVVILFAIYCVAILLDQIRMLIWNCFWTEIERKLVENRE